MLRGSSSFATRCRRNFRIRWECWGSSLFSSRSASSESSIFHAMALQHILQGDGPFLSVLNALQSALGEINVFEILEMLQDGFAHVEALGTSGTPRKFL